MPIATGSALESCPSSTFSTEELSRKPKFLFTITGPIANQCDVHAALTSFRLPCDLNSSNYVPGAICTYADKIGLQTSTYLLQARIFKERSKSPQHPYKYRPCFYKLKHRRKENGESLALWLPDSMLQTLVKKSYTLESPTPMILEELRIIRADDDLLEEVWKKIVSKGLRICSPPDIEKAEHSRGSASSGRDSSNSATTQEEDGSGGADTHLPELPLTVNTDSTRPSKYSNQASSSTNAQGFPPFEHHQELEKILHNSAGVSGPADGAQASSGVEDPFWTGASNLVSQIDWSVLDLLSKAPDPSLDSPIAPATMSLKENVRPVGYSSSVNEKRRRVETSPENDAPIDQIRRESLRTPHQISPPPCGESSRSSHIEEGICIPIEDLNDHITVKIQFGPKYVRFRFEK